FKPNNIKLYDNLGNNYPIRYGNCSEDNAFYERQVSFKTRETKSFSSHEYWCSDDTDLPVFFGPIPLDAQNLYLQLTEFGVFSKITFVFDL
ncbi:MAG: hypothetical protein Q7U74_15395, partial [Saprospiraceae bacterium]|nr:hypothetical protein [Saprospiraceae bacterium]